MKIGANNLLFFCNIKGQKPPVMEFQYILKEEIEEEILKAAVKDAMEVFPFFCLTPFLDEKGAVKAKENDQPVPVYPEDGKKRKLGTAQTNGYLFLVRYEGKKLKLLASHGIGDARGHSFFMQTLLYYYFSRKGIPVASEEILYTKENAEDLSIYDILFDKIKEVETREVEIEKLPEDFFYPQEEKVYRKTMDNRNLRILWKQEQFMERIRSVGATPLTFMFVMIARTMQEYYKTEKAIIGNVPVDMRGRLNSRAQSNFTAGIDLCYTREAGQKPLETQIQEFRADLKRKTQLDYLVSQLEQGRAGYEMIEQMTFESEEKLALLRDMLNMRLESSPERSFLLSNIGRIDMPEDIQPWIEDMDINGTNAEVTPVFSMFSYGSQGTLSVIQNYKEDGFVKALQKNLQEFGIECEFVDCGLQQFDEQCLEYFPSKSKGAAAGHRSE